MKKIITYLFQFISITGLTNMVSAQFSLSIDTVLVGDAGNASDSTGYGAVDYAFNIGTYEVTNAQYTTFLNAVAATDPHGLYITFMSGAYGGIERSGASGSYTYSTTSGWENKPVNFVSFWDAARFANWLTTGDTETGVYQLTATGISGNSIVRDPTAWAAGGVAVASEDEWYKAAYYDPTLNNGTGGYWLHAVQADTVSATEANFGNNTSMLTDVGSYGTASYYGTYDQGGNLFEWNEDVFDSISRVMRGGSFPESAAKMESVYRSTLAAGDSYADIGFRVASLAPIPEPSSVALFGGIAILLVVVIKRIGGRTRKPTGL